MSLRDELTAPVGTWTDEVETVLRRLPSEAPPEWEVYDWLYESHPGQSTTDEQYEQVSYFEYPSDSVQLAYLPNSIQPTTWIERTNSIEIRFTDWYPDNLDIDDKQEDGESKYLVTGTFITPFATRFPDVVSTRAASAMPRVSEATEVNAELERLARPDDWVGDYEEFSDDPVDYLEQTSPLFYIDRAGETTIERLADKFGAYYNVTVGEQRSIRSCLPYSNGPRVEAVIDGVQKALNRYIRFRSREDWDRVSIKPDKWTTFPKRHSK